MQALSFLSNVKLVHKINAAFGLVVGLVVIMVFMSQMGVTQIQGTFSDYRAMARQSLIMSALDSDLKTARVAVLKYRESGSDDARNEVLESISRIVDSHDRTAEIVTNEAMRNELFALEDLAKQYRGEFQSATVQQDKRDILVKELVDLGVAVREKNTQIAESAFKDNDGEAAYYSGRLQEHFLLGRYYANAFLLRNDASDMERALAEIAQSTKLQEELVARLENPARRKLAEEIGAGLVEYQKRFAEVVDVIRTRNELYGLMDDLGPRMMAGYSRLFAQVEEAQNELGPRAVDEMKAVGMKSLAVGVVIALLASACAFLIGKMFSSNITLVISQMDRLAKGDNKFQIGGAQRGDEIGLMAKALLVFQKNAQEVERMEAEKKESEARAAEERRKAMMELADDFDSQVGGIVDAVNKAAGEMQAMATQLASAVEETTSQSNSVASASEQTNANTQTVASATEELTASIREISRSVSDTAQTAKACAASARVSQEKLDLLQNAIGEIDSVIQAINEVAEQTNLLALNATIEAARAGEAGKGFAVVASEVKSLANQTHKMTDEIASKVTMIKDSAGSTITTINEILDQIETVDSKTANVAAAVEEQSSSTSEISRNIQEAARGSSEISKNVRGIQEAANDSAESTSTLKKASDGLASRAEELKRAVANFLNEVRAA